MSIVRLLGCTWEPLGSYLKALGVLRLLSEQEDSDARGWWAREGWFCMESRLDEAGLAKFFAERYRPAPIIAPWNGGSGFYPGDRTEGIEAIAASSDERFEVYRRVIRLARDIPEVSARPPREKKKGLQRAPVNAKAEEQRRTAIQLACRNSMPDECVDWLDAAIGISAEGGRFFPPILGTGGNDGNLDYTNNFMERVARLLLLPRPNAYALLRNCLFAEPSADFEKGVVGQYDPGRAGGFNQGEKVEIEGKDVPSNPWNFILTLEGAVAWAAGLYRRQGVAYRSFLCSPFTVRAAAVGYGSASAGDAGAARGEIWTPVWERPAGYPEIKALLREGRASVGGRPALNGLEFAEAASMLGVDRGISSFVRYNLLMRRGKSYIALPAGHFPVDYRTEADLIRQLEAVLEEARWRMKDAPGWFDSLMRRVEQAMYDCLLRGGALGLRDVAAATGRLMRAILLSGRTARFASQLAPEWIAALDRNPEARIAAAIAGMWQPGAGEFRDHLDRSNGRFSWTGATLTERMTRTLERRLVAGAAGESGGNPLRSRVRIWPQEVASFLEERLDDDLLEDLLFAFTLVDWKRDMPKWDRTNDGAGIWPVYLLLKHLFFDCPVSVTGDKEYLAADLNVLSALEADDVARAAELAMRRLTNAGLHPPEAVYAGGFDGMRLAASLLIPARYSNEFKRFCKSGEEE